MKGPVMNPVNERPFSRRPDNSAFKQQRLPAWTPMLTARSVLPFLYFTALICLLLGIWLILTVQTMQEIKLDYTEAGTCNKCFAKRKDVSLAGEPCNCAVIFTVEKMFKGDVFMYYGLKNFHQNLRRYMDSRDDTQMAGRKKHLKDPSSYCKPFVRDQNGSAIAPCGAVANSIFNDSFSLTYYGATGSGSVPVTLLRRGITWYTDKNVKYRNPSTENMTLADAFDGTVKPLYWQRPVYELDRDRTNNGFINEDLIVWMREAAFPNFKKLYGVLHRSRNPFKKGLPVGNYSIDINYNFPVQAFQGRKEVVLTTLTWFGGPNYFLPIAYLVTGSVVLLMAVALTAIWWKFGKNGKNMEE